MTGIGYSSYSDPRLQPPQDDAKEYFAERVNARVQDYLSDPEKSKKPMNGWTVRYRRPITKRWKSF